MGDPLQSQANVPNQPTKPPDLASNIVGQSTLLLPNLTTGHTPLQSGLTPQISSQFAATLGISPSEASAFSSGYGHAGGPPMDAPPPGDQFGRSFVDLLLHLQNLVPADSRPGPTRGSPNTHVPGPESFPLVPLTAPPLHESISAIQAQPNSAEPQLPSILQQSASALNTNLGVSDPDGLNLGHISHPHVAPDPVGSTGAAHNTQAAHPALPARVPTARQQAQLRPPPAAFSGPVCLPNFSAPIVPGPHVFPQEAQSALNNGRKTYAAAVTEKQAISSSERSMRKSFASVIQSAPDSACHQFVAKEPFLHRGEPALTITADEEASLAEPFKFTLVGKFSHRKPSMVEVRNSFQKFGFTGEFKIGLIDFKHILIHLTHEDDYSRLFLKPLWFIMGCPMRVLKWTCDFHPDAETPIAPVWISFPLLPVHLRAKEFLFALSKLVGVPLRIDEATADLLRPSEARVCVEVNLEHKLPDRVWIDRGESRSFWQLVVYEQLPHFCAKCRHMGHLIDKCRARMPPLDVEKVAQATKPVGAKASKPITIPKPTVDPATKPVDVELPVTDEVPLVDRIGKGKGKEVVVEPRKQWVPLASSSSIPPPVIPILPSEVHERPIHEHSSPVTTDMASQPVIAATDFDPLLDHMISLPREYPMLSEPVQPVFDPVPHTHPDLSCHENVETSITADTASSIQPGGHQQGHFRRNSSEDLVGLGERQEPDGFTTVQRKKSSKGIDIPRPNTRVTRSQTVILEPFVLKKNFDFIRRSLAFDVGLENESGKIWCFWNLGTTVASCVDHPQFLHIRVEDPRLPRPMYITPVYASCSPVGRRDLWMGLHQISLVVDGPWMVGGDFNVIAHNGERTGHNTRDRGTSDFADMMMDCGLNDAGPRPFRFLNVWSRHHDFLSFVSQKWSFPTHHTGMTALWEKIFRLKKGLRWWNRHVFGDIFQRVKDAECRVDEAESVYDSDPTPAHRNTLHQAQAGLNQTLSVEEAFWKQKAGARWIFFNKLVTKLLNSRLSNILPQIISAPQSRFIPGRLIGDNILLAQELLHTLDTKVRGGNASLKLDMAKAYDRLDWGFLISVLEGFGFDAIWIDRIQRCISECHFSVLLNGRPCGFFPSSRGLRQGDPISPSLFIIAADYFSRILTRQYQQIASMAYRHGGDALISHLCFADDMIIFANGQKQSIRRKVRSRISGWASRLLSPGGRITLIRSVLSSIPLYLLQILKPPKAVLKKLESIFARFLWDSKDHTHRLHWKRWKDLCLPTEEGGLGFRRLQDLVDTFSLKLWWLFRSQRSLWAQFLRDKEHPHHPHVEDQIVWTDTSDGRFVTKSAWQLVRTGSTIQAIYRMIWSSTIPTTVSFFCWRLWQGLIPVDVVIQRRIGSHMASRCQCCSAIETIQHLFIDSSTADTVWRHFADIFHITLRPLEGFQYRFQTWRFSAQRYSYGAEEDHLESLPHHLASAYRPLISAHPLAWRHGHRSAFWCHYYHPSPPPPTLVFWRTPPVGSYKINTDGCVKDGVASGGGIIRDSSGQCIRVFFSFYGECTILEAELRAILDGIILAQRLGLSVLWVESDSTLAIHCIIKGGGPWHVQATLRHIRHLLALDRNTITHIFREGNQVADLLASEGWDRRYYYEYSSQDLPRRHRSLVQIDRFELPTVRGL
ncbi:Uncharacterized protein Adt_22983 [Abeliophyllum distichum]|uniref:Reverse transcriptase domain-containing protein n=1 Tax=Abeliophyllum distichum TaxID=126358 RepID=A0ABD1S9J8_9LAMI